MFFKSQQMVGSVDLTEPAAAYAYQRAKKQHRHLFLGAVLQIALVSIVAVCFHPRRWEPFFTSFLITFVANYLVAEFSFQNRANLFRLFLLLLIDFIVVFFLFWNLYVYQHPLGFALFEFAAVELALFFISLVTSIVIQALVGSGRGDAKGKVPNCLKYSVWGVIWFFHLWVCVLLYLYRTVRVGQDGIQIVH